MWIFGKAFGFALAVLLAVLSGMRGGIPKRLWLVGAAGFVAILASTLWRDGALEAILGRAPRYEGLPMLVLYGALVWTGTTITPGSTARKALPEAMTAAAIILGITSLTGLFGFNPLGTFAQARDGSLLGNATDQGLVGLLFLAALAPIAWRQRDLLLGTGALFALTTVAASGSRAAILGSVVAAGVVALGSGRRAMPYVGVITLGLATLVVLIGPTRDRLTSGFSVDARWQGWMMTLDLIRDQPFLGVGLGGYADSIGAYETMTWAHTVGAQNSILNSPHSWPLQFVAVAGVLGLIVAIALIVTVGILLVRALRSPHSDDLTLGLVAGAVGFGCGLGVNFTIIGSTGLALVILGAALAPATSAPRQPAGAIRVMAASTAVCIAALGIGAEIAISHGDAAFRAGDAERGQSAYRIAHFLRPNTLDVAGRAALRFTGSTSPEVRAAGRELAQQALDGIPTSYRARLALATYLNDSHQYADALALLEPLTVDFPRRALPRFQHARAHFGLHHLKRARTAAQMTLRLDPWHDGAQQMLIGLDPKLRVKAKQRS